MVLLVERRIFRQGLMIFRVSLKPFVKGRTRQGYQRGILGGPVFRLGLTAV